VDKQTFREANDKAKKKKEAPQYRSRSCSDHQGQSHDAVVHLGGELPGDDASSHRRRDSWRAGRAARLKENIIIGHLIPAGTGMYRYQEVEIEGAPVPPAPELPPEPTIAEILASDTDTDFALPETVAVPEEI